MTFISGSLAALAAEPNPYATAAESASSGAVAAGAGATVTALPTQRQHKGRWFVGSAGIAAASVVALVVGTTVLDGESNTNPPLASVAIPMSASTKQYQKEKLHIPGQAGSARMASAAASAARSASASPSSDSSRASSSNVSASPSPSGSATALQVDKTFA